MCAPPGSPRRRHLVAAPDKFRGTARAVEVAAAAVSAAEVAGWSASAMPMADGGEGTLEALGGEPRHLVVSGPLGGRVVAEWRWFDRQLLGPAPGPAAPSRGVAGDGWAGTPAPFHGEGHILLTSGGGRYGGSPAAVIEMARCSGLALVGGAGHNDPVGASTVGTGELIAAAIEAGARQVVVACGGSASTDGGLGALEALGFSPPSSGADLVAACDVDTRFVESAATFAPQKGADRAQVRLLSSRLEAVARLYEERLGVDVRRIPGGGAAGGLAGGLAAIGARLVPGFALVAGARGLAGTLAGADLVVTGEGHLDAQSFRGKVVGGVLSLARHAGVPALVVVGGSDPLAVAEATGTAGGQVAVVCLATTVGREQALAHPLQVVEAAVARHLASLDPG